MDTDYSTRHTRGYIYAVRVEDSPYVKIGKTTRPVSIRFNQYRSQYKDGCTLIAAVYVPKDLDEIERQIHRILENWRIGHGNSEWFEIKIDLLTLQALVLRAIRERKRKA